MCPAEPVQPRCRQHDRIKLPFIELSQTCVYIAADWLHRYVGPRCRELRHAAQRSGADSRAGWKRCELASDHDIAWVFTLRRRSDLQSVGKLSRHVLQAMNGEVNAAVEQ